jgi:hypothetical protein
MTNPSGAVTPEAQALNEGRVTYDGGAARAREQDIRRLMMEGLPADRILDAEHMEDLIEHVATWAPDAVRQKMLRKAGSGQLWGRVLHQSEWDELQAKALAYLSK